MKPLLCKGILCGLNSLFVKLQIPNSKVQASALRLGVDFVFPLSQEEEQQQEQETPPKYTRRKHPRSLKFVTKTDTLVFLSSAYVISPGPTSRNSVFVKLQSKVQASALRLGVDFVFPLSQEQEQQL